MFSSAGSSTPTSLASVTGRFFLISTPRLICYQPWWIDKHLDGLVGDGGVFSTAEDLRAFSQAFFSGRLLGELTTAALTPVRLKNGGFQYNGVGGGLGWQLRFEGDDAKPVAAFHTGNYGGFLTLLWRDLRADRTCILLDNLSHNLEDIAGAVQGILAGKAWQSPRKSIQDVMLLAIHQEGIEGALQTYRKLKTSGAQDYLFGERELNTVGYILLRDRRVDEAIKIFKLNAEEYPGSFNAFDSLAEAYVAKDDVRQAIRCYEEAVKLNPGYRQGIEVLKALRGRLPAQHQ